MHDVAFVKRYLHETRACILPYAEQVNPDMFRELSDLVDNREKMLPLWGAGSDRLTALLPPPTRVTCPGQTG